MISRRGFLGRLGAAAGGMIVAPTLVETLAIGAKKYFFLGGREYNYWAYSPEVVALQLEKVRAKLTTVYLSRDLTGQYYWDQSREFQFNGLSQERWPR